MPSYDRAERSRKRRPRSITARELHRGAWRTCVASICCSPRTSGSTARSASSRSGLLPSTPTVADGRPSPRPVHFCCGRPVASRGSFSTLRARACDGTKKTRAAVEPLDHRRVHDRPRSGSVSPPHRGPGSRSVVSSFRAEPGDARSRRAVAAGRVRRPERLSYSCRRGGSRYGDADEQLANAVPRRCSDRQAHDRRVPHRYPRDNLPRTGSRSWSDSPSAVAYPPRASVFSIAEGGGRRCDKPLMVGGSLFSHPAEALQSSELHDRITYTERNRRASQDGYDFRSAGSA